jgi:Domain of unknown function (DUF4390)
LFPPPRPQTQADLQDVQLQRSDGQWLVSAQTRLQLGPGIEEALLKGVAVHFVAQVEVVRQRWYWTDKTVLQASRHYRLAYQPLTRKWRLNMASEPLSASSLATSLSQTFETLAEALAPVRRVAGWKIADARQLDPDTPYTVYFRFWLDAQQLPRPFQFGASAQADWNLSLSRRFRLEPVAQGS